MVPWTLLYAFLAGTVLSALRAPMGLDLTHVPAVDATTAALFRAGALLGVVLFLDSSRPLFRRGVPVGSVLLCACVGFLAHGLFFAPLWEPSTRMGYTIVLVALTLALYWISGRGDASEPDREPAEEPKRVETTERLGLVLLGVGVAIGFENLARHTRLLSTGIPENDTLMVGVLLLLMAIGARAFGRPLARPSWRRPLLCAGLSLAVASTLIGLSFIGGLATGDGLFRYLRRFGLDITGVGTLPSDLLLASACLVVPGFLAGAGLAGARHAKRLSSVVGGAAVGTLLAPVLVRAFVEPYPFPDVLEVAWAWRMLALGTIVAAVGAIVALLGDVPRRPRVAGIALAIGAAAFVVAGPRPTVWPFTPWFQADIEPLLVMQLPEGLFTIEPDRRGGTMATLDRKRLSPTAEEERADRQRLAQAWLLLPPELRAGGTARVLLVGHMSPTRASHLAGLGEMRLDRTAPWFAAMEAAEDLLFGELEPPGALISPAEANDRIADGVYDLVVVLPVHGVMLPFKGIAVLPWASPVEAVTEGFRVPDGTLAVVWSDAAAPIRRDHGERVVLASHAAEGLSIGVVIGTPSEASLAAGPTLYPAPEGVWTAAGLSLLFKRAALRPADHLAQNTRQLERAAAGTPHEKLMHGLRLHYAAQKASNPWETRAEQVELDKRALQSLSEAALETPPGPFVRELWEGLAFTLTEKRMPDLVLSYVRPLTDAHGPWPALDRAVATAFEEFDEKVDVVYYLNRLLAANPNDIGVLVECADWLSRLGDQVGAIELLTDALALQPGRYEIERRLGMALVRAGEAEGREILTRLSEEHPEDEEIRAYLSDGPLPPLPQGFRPASEFHGDEH